MNNKQVLKFGITKHFLYLVLIFQMMFFTKSYLGEDLKRPQIIGINHASFKVSDINKSRDYYGKILGYQEALTFFYADETISLSIFKVNDHQYIELTPNLKSEKGDRLNHIAFETTDIKTMHTYLASKGIKVPDKINVGRDKNLHMTVTDPDGHTVEFVQCVAGSLHSEAKGKYLSDIRISERVQHLGIIVKDETASDKFYKDILGFIEIWRGGTKDSVTDWINMRLPESTNYIEYMLQKEEPTEQKLHASHHICLLVPDLEKAIQTLRERSDGSRIFTPQLGKNKRWILNLFDPDGTRVELMEPHTFK